MLLELLLVLVALSIILFGWVVLTGAPYVPTLRQQIEAALDLLDLRPGQSLIEVGSGDGRVLAAAAARGLHATGYEINPVLVAYSRWQLRRYPDVRVIWSNAWTTKWPPTDGVYVFGLQKLMTKVHKKIVQSNRRPVKLASVGFQLPHVLPIREQSGVYLYEINPSAERLQSGA